MVQMAFDHGGFPAYQKAGALLIHTPEYFNEHADQILSAKGSWGEFQEADVAAFRRVQTATNAHDARAVLPSIQAPCLIVHGELDVVDPPRLGEELVRLIPNSRMEVIPDTPHAMRTNPVGFERLGAIVTAFYSQLETVQRQAASWNASKN